MPSQPARERTFLAQGLEAANPQHTTGVWKAFRVSKIYRKAVLDWDTGDFPYCLTFSHADVLVSRPIEGNPGDSRAEHRKIKLEKNKIGALTEAPGL